MKDIKFSIIIPVYNKAQTASRAIDSVLVQPGEWELIIIDDGSSDDIDKVLFKYKDDNRITIIKQKNQGVSVARNTGILSAKYKYICFVDADDRWLPNMLTVLSKLISSYPTVAMYATATKFIQTGQKESDNAHLLPNKGSEYVEDFLLYMHSIGGEYILYTDSVCVKAETFKRVGMFEPGVRIGEDYDLWIRIAARYPVALSNEVAAVYHKESSTATSATDMDINWFFQNREDALLGDNAIAQSRKDNLLLFMDRFRIRKSRHLMLNGKKKQAYNALLKVVNKRQLLKQCIITALCLIVPARLLRAVYRRAKV